MAITATLGATINNAVAGTSLAFGSQSLTLGQLIVVCIAILDTTKSVSSISDGSANVYTFRGGVNSGSAVRSEIWTCPITAATANRIITVTLSGSSLASATYEEYAGVTTLGNISSGVSGSSFYTTDSVATQDGNNWTVGSIAVASTSGDTFIANYGTIRQPIIPALTTAASGLIDNSSTGVVSALYDGVRISASRAWAAISLELRSGSSTIGWVASKVITPIISAGSGTQHQPVRGPALGTFAPTYFNPIPIGAVLQGGVTGVGYSETITAQGGTAPYAFTVISGSVPTGTSMSSAGLITGTPTVVAANVFTVRVTDINGFTGSQSFTINITAPASSTNSYSYLS